MTAALPAALGALCALAARPRDHVPHLVMASMAVAMLAMTTPRADPLGPWGWSLAFLPLIAVVLRMAPLQLRTAYDLTGMACVSLAQLHDLVSDVKEGALDKLFAAEVS
jgi:hypothetical protein